jgi:hypothetical protein
VVVRGTAEVTIGHKVSTVHENESVYVPIGAVHRLANPGKIPLELVEVQSGSYLGEDDIERFDDVYRRDQVWSDLPSGDECATMAVSAEFAVHAKIADRAQHFAAIAEHDT